MSVSRARRIEQCEEQDRLHTDGARGGYRADAPRFARLLHKLKQVQSIEGALGVGVHDAAATYLRALRDGRRPPTGDALVDIVLARLNAPAGKGSRDVGAWLAAGADVPIYREVLRGEWPDGRVPDDVAEKARFRARSLVRRLLSHPVIGDLHECGRGDIVVCDVRDSLLAELANGPVKVFAAPDAIFHLAVTRELPGLPVPVPRDTPVILDWKTGRAAARVDEVRDQLCVYAWYAAARLGVRPGPLGYLGRCASLNAATEEEADMYWLLGPADVAHGHRILERAAALLAARADADGAVPPARATRSLTACRFCTFDVVCASPERMPKEVAAFLGVTPSGNGSKAPAGDTE